MREADAAVREVPIHGKLAVSVKRLKKNSTDGYLLSGLTFNKYGDRSNAIGKRFVNRPGFELTPRSWTNFKGFHEEVQNGVQAGSRAELPGG